MTESTATERPRGRPRSPASRGAILSAAFDLLRERGYAGLAIEAVAERAGVGKATIYRWWPDRAALAVEAFFEATREALAFPDTGSAREDFRRQIHGVADLLRGSGARRWPRWSRGRGPIRRSAARWPSAGSCPGSGGE
ncbi:TetR/AcrR family transcriptional regulator [Roseomonas sp. CCTCC AB2023176]|uniref:TetR/AcrR family transcriptional regulator n=1 Tax=Roseomonas sp. CCTCC AB2023176 TaxID=3342640 RepID=UPI0035DA72C5